MPASIRTPRAKWIEVGLQVLADGGPEAVRVEALAEALGVTKGGFYWHFENRKAFLEEMLETWERGSAELVIEQIEAGGGDARERLRSLISYAANSPLLLPELSIRDWGRREPRIIERLRRVDNRRMDYMRSLFGELTADPDEVEIRCTILFSLFVGTGYIASDNGNRSPGELFLLALERLLA